MAKLTRRSFKRKKIVVGAIFLGGVALVSTGFAAWVLSSGAKETKDGNINVAQVSAEGLTIENIALSANSFKFDTTADANGPVIYTPENSDTECLTTVVTGYIGNSSHLGGLTMGLTVPDSIKAAATEGYIVLPDCVATPYVFSAAEITAIKATSNPASSNDHKFSHTISFAWGTKFGGNNPADYFNNPARTPAEVEGSVEYMADFRATMFGFTIDKTGDTPIYTLGNSVLDMNQMLSYTPAEGSGLTFTVTITATTSSGN